MTLPSRQNSTATHSRHHRALLPLIATGLALCGLSISGAAQAQTCSEVRGQLSSANQALLQEIESHPMSTLCALAGAGTAVDALSRSLEQNPQFRTTLRTTAAMCIPYCAYGESANCGEQLKRVLLLAPAYATLKQDEQRSCGS